VDLHVPRVEVDFIQQAVVQPEAVSSGIVRPANSERIFAPISGRIIQILEPGAAIDARTVLFTISNDISALYDMLADAEHQRSIVVLNTQRTIADQQYEQQRLQNMLAGTDTPPTPPTLNLWDYDMQLENNLNEAARIQGEMETLEILYEEGIIPRQDIVARDGELERLAQQREQIYRQRNQAITNHEAALTAHQNAIDNAEQNRAAQITNQQNRVNQLDFAMTSHNMELTQIDNRIYSLQTQIADDGATEVRLDEGDIASRTVTELLPGIDVGTFVQEGMPIMQTILNDDRFVIEASFPLVHEFITPDQRAEVTIGNAQHVGSTRQVRSDGGLNIVTIELTSDTLRGGELAQVNISAPSNMHASTIPLSALSRDTTGYFVLFVESVRGFLGSNYYASMQRVLVTTTDNTRAAIIGSFGTALPEDGVIIVNSDMPVHTGERVRLVGGGDFTPTR